MCNSYCDIENSLTTNTSCGINCEEVGLGNISVYPQKSCYLKGERVHAWFEEGPNPDYIFCNWLSSPPDVYSTNNPFPYTIVQIKDQTQFLTAFSSKNKVTLTVQCDIASFLMTGNRLSVPSGAEVQYTIINGEQVPWRYEVEYCRGALVDVSVIPSSGYIIDWHGNSICEGIRYNQSSINVLMIGDVNITPVAIHINDYNFDFHTMSMSIVGGEGVLLSGGYVYSQNGCNVPLFPYESALSYGRFRVAVVSGFVKSLAYWYCSPEDLYCPSEVAEAVFPVNGNKSHSATAVLVDKVYLITPDPLGLKFIDHVSYYEYNQGGIAKITSSLLYPPSFFDPYPLGWNPLPYGSTHSNEFRPFENLYECPTCNAVELEPLPCLGAEFLYWEVSTDGDTWIPVPRNSINPNLTVYMNYFGPFDPIHYPDNIHVPTESTNLYVRPVFRVYCDFVYGYCNGPDGRDVIIDMYENPDVLCKGLPYPGPAPDCDKYVTNIPGHPSAYSKGNLLPFDKLQCKHNSSDYRHDGWAIEDGIAECYAAIEQAYAGTITITSVYRCPLHNAIEGGKRTSKHLLGKAFDFDQLSSEANWDVAKTAYDKNQNWEILLYENGEEKVFNPKIPRTPPQGKEYTHGHIGIN